MSDGKMKFIRKNGRIIPIKDRGESWKEGDNKLVITQKLKKTTDKQKVINSSGVAALSGATSAMYLGSVKASSLSKFAVIGAMSALGGAIGYLATPKKTREIDIKTFGEIRRKKIQGKKESNLSKEKMHLERHANT